MLAELARRLSHVNPTVRRIAALDAARVDPIDDTLLLRLGTLILEETDAKTRVLLARLVERHAPGRAIAPGLVPAIEAAAAACDEPLGRHALILARDAVEASIVRE
ncbi:MAG: hypothetical protein WCK33_01045 [Phycisphaerae bacterium]